MHSNILAWRISRTEEPGGYRLQSMGRRVGHDQASSLSVSLFTFSHLPFVSPDVSAESEKSRLLQMSFNRRSPRS